MTSAEKNILRNIKADTISNQRVYVSSVCVMPIANRKSTKFLTLRKVDNEGIAIV